MYTIPYTLSFIVVRFYEWNRKSSHKQPYLIHLADTSPSPDMMELASQTTDEETPEVIDGFSDVVGGRMLAMAGLFDVWTREESVRVHSVA